MTIPNPMPVPTTRHATTPTPRATPRACSPIAHRLASFSTTTSEPCAPSADVSSRSSPRRSQPGRFGARRMDPAAASGMPGVPTTVTTMSPPLRPAAATARRTVSATVCSSVAPDRLRLGSSDRATTVPSRSATATCTTRLPTSTPTMYPASGAVR